MSKKKTIVYVIGAGFSAGLGFPTIGTLLSEIWPRLKKDGSANNLAAIIKFHHPRFDPKKPNTFKTFNVERLLSEMKANEELFDSSRPETGSFTPEDLDKHRHALLLTISTWFHELQKNQ